jgi:hypothetical protein
MLPLVASPKHYYPATEYDEILPSGATQSCHLNGSGLDCQIPLSEAAWRLRSEQQGRNVDKCRVPRQELENRPLA